MSHLVIWSRRAMNQLTTFWTNSNSALRTAITKAVDRIDTELKIDPHRRGESRPDGRRIDFFQPLGILFEVKQGFVRIVFVWDARRKR